MRSRQKISIVIAAFDEEMKIQDVVKGIRAAGHSDIIVVDDGSRDATGRRAYAGGATVLRHAINRGQGAALKTGIDYALKQGADIIVTFDADGQHEPREIKNMVAPIANGSVGAALGSRFLTKQSNVPFLRKMALKAGAILMRCMYGMSLTDSHNGFRALSRDTVARLELHADKMDHASEIVGEIGKKRIRYCEVPVTIKYTDYSMKHSKQGPLPSIRIGWKMIMQKVMR